MTELSKLLILKVLEFHNNQVICGSSNGLDNSLNQKFSKF